MARMVHASLRVALAQLLLLAAARCASMNNARSAASVPGRGVSMQQVNVCTNYWCKDKGSGATLASFIGLAPDDETLVCGVDCLGRCNKGPNIQVKRRDGEWFEFNGIDSVDKVYKVLVDHMDCDVSAAAAECLQHNFDGNAHLDRNEVQKAIESYDNAIRTGFADQEGVILVMRSTAYLQRAFTHRMNVRALLDKGAGQSDLNVESVGAMFAIAEALPHGAPRVMDLLVAAGEEQATTYHDLRLSHGLYEFAALQACEDAVKATQLLPNYSKCWLRAGEALAELRRTEEALGYFQTAVTLDPSLAAVIQPVVERLKEGR